MKTGSPKKINIAEFKSLGTKIKIFLVLEDFSKEDQAVECIKKIKAIYKEKESLLSRFDPKSELSRINSNLGIFHKSSQDLVHLTQSSLEFYKESHHYFDPRILEALENIGYESDFETLDLRGQKINKISPVLKGNLANDLEVRGGGVIFKKRMDFSGIAKGYITDLISKFLKDNGWRNFLVDSGGDIFAFGQNEWGEDWKVEVEGISEKNIMLKLKNSAVATSGITRRKWEISGKRYHHLINPKNPNEFNFDLKSVTVVENNCEKADVSAKILYLMGREEGLKYSEEKKIKSIFLDYHANIYLSQGIRELID